LNLFFFFKNDLIDLCPFHCSSKDSKASTSLPPCKTIEIRHLDAPVAPPPSELPTTTAVWISAPHLNRSFAPLSSSPNFPPMDLQWHQIELPVTPSVVDNFLASPQSHQLHRGCRDQQHIDSDRHSNAILEQITLSKKVPVWLEAILSCPHMQPKITRCDFMATSDQNVPEGSDASVTRVNILQYRQIFPPRVMFVPPIVVINQTSSPLMVRTGGSGGVVADANEPCFVDSFPRGSSKPFESIQVNQCLTIIHVFLAMAQ
jgi:hypothetical protein